MDFPLLIGQDRIAETLASSVQSGRVAHAYLFFGPEGSGKRAAAIGFAASLLCAEPKEGAACGVCNACQRVVKLGHPDIQLLMPVPKDTAPSEVSERIAAMAANPYAVVDFERRPSLENPEAVSNKQVIYSKDRIGRDLRREMSLAPVEGGYRIAILTDADRMRTDAANAFLKLLEEPGKKTVLILITDRPDRLLATIRSRCQLLRFTRLSDEEVAAALVKRLGVDPATAETLSRMADGSFSRALELVSNEELYGTREMVVEFLRASYVSNGDTIVDFAERLNRMGRETLKFFLSLMLGWLRDLLLFRTVGETARVVNLDQYDEIRKFCRNLPSARIESMVALVEEAAYLTERNMNLRLTFIVLSQALGRAMHGESVSHLVVSLSDEPVTM